MYISWKNFTVTKKLHVQMLYLTIEVQPSEKKYFLWLLYNKSSKNTFYDVFLVIILNYH